MRWISRRRVKWLTLLFCAFTITGTGPFYILFFIAVDRRRGFHFLPRPEELVCALLGSLASLFVAETVKLLVRRRRPYNSDPEVRPILPPSRHSLSFPSSHASTTFGFVVALALLGHPLAAPALAWAMIVALSRFYLALHYPTDILAGIVCGLLVGPSGYILYQTIGLLF